MKKLAPIALSLVLMLAGTACTVQTHGSTSFGRGPHQLPNGAPVLVEYGELLALQIVSSPKGKDKTAQTVGSALLGGAIGAGLGNAIGRGKARKNAAMIGAAAGALSAGSAAAQAAAAEPTIVAYTVAKDDGTNVLIQQAIADGEAAIQPGQRVLIQNAGGQLRVFAAPEAPVKTGKKKG